MTRKRAVNVVRHGNILQKLHWLYLKSFYKRNVAAFPAASVDFRMLRNLISSGKSITWHIMSNSANNKNAQILLNLCFVIGRKHTVCSPKLGLEQCLQSFEYSYSGSPTHWLFRIIIQGMCLQRTSQYYAGVGAQWLAACCLIDFVHPFKSFK